MPVEALKQSPLMNHMVEALARGEDIGHYGRLTFIISHLISWTTKSSWGF